MHTASSSEVENNQAPILDFARIDTRLRSNWHSTSLELTLDFARIDKSKATQIILIL